MSQNLAAFTPIKFSLKLIDILYNETIYPNITNTKYEGELKQSGDRVRVRMAHKIGLKKYTKGMPLVAGDLNPVFEDLVITEQQYFKFVVDDVDKIQNDIDAINEYASIAKRDISEMLDKDILSYMRKNVNAANAIGGVYSTGTVEVSAAGAVTGTSTVVTDEMVGGIVKIAGVEGSWLLSARTGNEAFTITGLGGEPYTGGAVAAGATYSITAASPVSLTDANIYTEILKLRKALNKALVPAEGRFLVVNSDVESLLLSSSHYIPAVDAAYEGVVREGKIGKVAGFDVYRSELVDGNNTTGYWILAGTKEFCSMALQINDVAILPSQADPNSFVATCKGLVVWGRKVFSGNRGYGAVLRGKV